MPKRIERIVGSNAGSFVAAGPENPAAFVCANARHKQLLLWPQVVKSEITVNHSGEGRARTASVAIALQFRPISRPAPVAS